MELTHDVWRCLFDTHFAALRLTFSMELISFSVWGSQTVVAYASIDPYRPNKSFVRSFLSLLIADLEAAPKEANCLVGFVGNGVDMRVPFHVVLEIDTKVLCGGDVFNGMPMQLICLLLLLCLGFFRLRVTFSPVHFGG